MKISKIWIWLSVLAGFGAAAASAAGVFIPSTYAKETANWAAQGVGQDIVNLFIGFPAILISAYFVNKGSYRAFLLWLGLLIYLIYSYILYSFFIHFGPWFPVYVFVLGASFYAFTGSLMSLDKNIIAGNFINSKVKAASLFLMFISVMF